VTAINRKTSSYTSWYIIYLFFSSPQQIPNSVSIETKKKTNGCFQAQMHVQTHAGSK